MTKDDDMEDEFVEALNPNLAMPRSALRPEMKSSGWFPVILSKFVITNISKYVFRTRLVIHFTAGSV
ncbi:unnamed protein product, partial [Rotaria sp. Silwood1]